MTGPTVLIAEDDRFLRRAAELTLRRRGYHVLVAADGQDALAQARQHRPALILLDLLMPRMTGLEVLRALREDVATRALPVLILSNSSKDLDIETAETLGVSGYWIKADLSLQELCDRVGLLLAA